VSRPTGPPHGRPGGSGPDMAWRGPLLRVKGACTYSGEGCVHVRSASARPCGPRDRIARHPPSAVASRQRRASACVVSLTLSYNHGVVSLCGVVDHGCVLKCGIRCHRIET